MRRTILIVVVLLFVAFSNISQSRLLQTKTAPKSVQAYLYYPDGGSNGSIPPETVNLPVEFQVPQKDWQWSVKDGCLEYRVGDQDTTFCGTFKIVRNY